MKVKFRRGQEKNRKKIIPENGEMLYTTDTNRIYVGDGNTAGGVPIRPFSIYEWDFETVLDQTEYSPAENETALCDPSGGLYIVFYGAAKMAKEDYSIDAPSNKLILNISPPEDGITLTVYYVGI